MKRRSIEAITTKGYNTFALKRELVYTKAIKVLPKGSEMRVRI